MSPAFFVRYVLTICGIPLAQMISDPDVPNISKNIEVFIGLLHIYPESVFNHQISIIIPRNKYYLSIGGQWTCIF